MTKSIMGLCGLCLTACTGTPQTSTDTIAIADTRITLGMAYLQNGQRVKARANLLKAKEIAPFYIRGQLAQAYYYDVIGESKKADKQYAEALSSHPHNPDALNNYGTFLCKQGQYQQAQDYFLQAYSQHRYPLIADAYENAGLCAIKTGQLHQAKPLFQKALDYDPSRIQSLVHLVDIEMTFFEYERAEKQVKQFIRQFGSAAQTTRLLNLLFQKQQQQNRVMPSS